MTYSNEKITREQFITIDKLREEVINKLRDCELKLYSPEIQNEFENLIDIVKKRKFIDERIELSVLRVKLESATLERIAARLKCLEEDLNKGLEALGESIDNVQNTVDILTTIKNVTGLVARILVIL
ncbi:hypothetical protein [Nostoc sp. 'Peltigera membranacea cyanobiont' N6]|uniref:hypothetical protein n=1 Tax=Nostoc sp. 'Peltigera membranacea cyanobiont' N6 TaxID=1261031 RepID=UPI000CF32D37|nr:hypothetical protein [Nostoc sp. 'Peltigera membranacea cyanobiont' N6]AVH66633.1 hypothetical protein NPM_5177 [Nostoc sp. 'Peltigera membranacea cyanobiont' N6]